jgi:hypothetical protein
VTIVTYSQARQNFSSLLDMAQKEGSVLVVRKDGQTFSISPSAKVKSPLAVRGIHVRVSSKDIVSAIHESRRHKAV